MISPSHDFSPSDSPLRWWQARREFWVLQGFGGLAVAVCGFIVATRLGFEPLQVAGVVTARSFIGLVLTTLLLRPWLRFLLARMKSHAGIAAASLAACGILTFLDQLAMAALLPVTVAPRGGLSLDELFRSFLPMRIVAYSIWCAFYFSLRHWLLRREEEWTIARAEAAAAKAELQLLRAQVNPHFIFNVLNSILAVTGDEQRVSSMIQALSRHLRFACGRTRAHHDLADELAAVENYIEIERFRFDDGLLFHANVEDDCLASAVPAGCLMIPVENAIKHGSQTSPRPLRIDVAGWLDHGQLHLRVSNTGDWREAEPGHPGIGMPNLSQTLARLFGDKSSVTTTLDPGQVTIHIQLPAVAR
jgi:hypothetical protein